MMESVLLRSIVSVAVIGAFFVLAKGLARSRLLRIRSELKEASDITNPDGSARLIYFWSPLCAQCPAQERHIQRARVLIQEQQSDFRVEKINAVEDRDLARTYHVFTLPTTVQIDASGELIAVNSGLTPAATIVNQFTREPAEVEA